MTPTQLSDKQLSQFRLWLSEKGPDHTTPCSFCGKDDWEISSNVFSHPGSIDASGSGDFAGVLGLVGVFCTNCGFALLFDASRMDLGTP